MSKNEVMQNFASRKLAENSAKNFAIENKPYQSGVRKKLPVKTYARNKVKNAIQKQHITMLVKMLQCKNIAKTVQEKLYHLQSVSTFSSNKLRIKDIPRNTAKKTRAIKPRIWMLVDNLLK